MDSKYLIPSTFATAFGSRVGGVLHLMHDFDERRHGMRHRRVLFAQSLGRLQHTVFHVLGVTRAASTLGAFRGRLFGRTRRFVALQFALGFGASGRFLTFPVAFGFLAHGSTHWFRSNTAGTAIGRRAHSFTFGAVVLLAHVFRTTNVALGFVAVNFAFGTSSFFTLDLTLGSFAHRVTLGRAHGVVTLPTALRVTRFFRFHKGRFGNHHGRQDRQHGHEQDILHHHVERGRRRNDTTHVLIDKRLLRQSALAITY